MKGYKIFNSDFTCRGFQFEEGKTYEMDGEIEICRRGFHFCTKASHCFSYYSFDSTNIVCEVEALGDTKSHDEDSKVCTNILKIVKKLTWEEVLQVANEGCNNTGHSNTGDRNTGDINTGDWNTGDRNTGDSNTGYRNTGDSNTGYRNTGDSNTGYRNTGDSNTGDWNTGDSNTGYRNTGDWNTGYRNTGYRNTGDWNTGDWNTGYRNTGHSNTGYRNTGDSNTGDSNTGDWNTGDWNTGDWNTGYSNTGDRNTGAFCTGEKYMRFFNKESDWTEEKFKRSDAYSLLCNVNTKFWVYSENMNKEEKEIFPSHETTGGYLKDIPYKEAFQNMWHNLNDEGKASFTSLPNFDAEIFFQITGIKI